MTIPTEANFSTTDKLLALFTHARINGVRLDESLADLGWGADKELLREAMLYRWHMEDTRKSGSMDEYRASIRKGCERLAAAN